ncbi:hypothetical protein L1887_57770 [Cichorium endivia]|nr:hypothetical protein L1887_57770 [Cichorium endivia]
MAGALISPPSLRTFHILAYTDTNPTLPTISPTVAHLWWRSRDARHCGGYNPAPLEARRAGNRTPSTLITTKPDAADSNRADQVGTWTLAGWMVGAEATAVNGASMLVGGVGCVKVQFGG